MKKTPLPRLLLLVVVLLPATARAITGDAEAIAWARNMIVQMGGREVWSAATGLHIVEKAYRSDIDVVARAEFWRRFDEPGYWYNYTAPERQFSRRGGWNQAGGWAVREGKGAPFTRERLQQETGWWRREVYTMYHRLAKEDPALRLTRVADRRFNVLEDATGELLCWFEVGQVGDPVRWGAAYGTATVEYVYGPLKTFGPVRMPDWGAQTNGTFRFYYAEVAVVTEKWIPPLDSAQAP